MDSNVLEVKILLGVLLHKIKRSNIQLQLKDLSMAIIGVLQTSDWIRDDYLNVLATKTNITMIKSPGREQLWVSKWVSKWVRVGTALISIYKW